MHLFRIALSKRRGEKKEKRKNRKNDASMTIFIGVLSVISIWIGARSTLLLAFGLNV